MQELRTTTGQRIVVSYDPVRNALIFRETDWFADPLRSTAVPGKARAIRALAAARIAARGRRKRKV